MSLNQVFRLIVLLLILNACSADDLIDTDQMGYDWSTHTPFKVSYNTFNMPYTEAYDPLPAEQGTVSLSEASGIAKSVKNPGKIWAHNDSGHPNILFLIDAETGQIVSRYTIGGSLNIDWEDIEISKGPVEGEVYLYISDTGDNDKKRPSYSVYRFPEPIFEESHTGKTILLSNLEIDRLNFKFPDGSHDTEAMFVDPHTLDIYFATKRDVVSMLYVAPYPQDTENQFTLIKAGEFGFREASAGSLALDGSRVVIKNRQEIFYWERQEGEHTVEMLERTPQKAPYTGEPQGEAICFDEQYNYYTLSEALNADTPPILYKYFYLN